MAPRILLVAHAPTEAVRRAAFPVDEPGTDLPDPVPMRAATVLTGPELRCRQTAAALGWSAEVEPGLADLDAGRWRGRTLDSLLADEPAALAEWLSDPSVTPHRGESLTRLIDRVGAALAPRVGSGRTVAVVSPLVVRAAVVHLLRAPASLIFGIDVAPLTAVGLSGHGGRWVLQSMRPVRQAGGPR